MHQSSMYLVLVPHGEAGRPISIVIYLDFEADMNKCNYKLVHYNHNGKKLYNHNIYILNLSLRHDCQ